MKNPNACVCLFHVLLVRYKRKSSSNVMQQPQPKQRAQLCVEAEAEAGQRANAVLTNLKYTESSSKRAERH